MEQFGGGGHQNVAGSQVKNRPLKELKQDVVNTTLSYMKEADKNESNNVARS
jgi:c-di-AMP phosphodiesterase-like protein